ncbi:MAG: transposase [Candidatus Zixiibacteriota bacterium]|nr:MAG: transposase [candidate division Zixibacteria bacterium]
MKTFRRFDLRNRYYFITVVTYNREKLMLNDIDLFWQCWVDAPPDAWVILPDHFHSIIKIDKISMSEIMHKFKITYSRRYRDKYRKGRVWQNRYWDHIIRNQDDLNRHLDYIHYNPVKHGIVQDPFEYNHSSLTDYYKEGYYDRDWGVKDILEFDGDFGE